MQSMERMKAARLKSKGISAHRRLITSEARMLKDVSAQQKECANEVEDSKVEGNECRGK